MFQITFSIQGFKADFGDSNDMANKLGLQYIQAFHKPISSMISNSTVNDFVDEFFVSYKTKPMIDSYLSWKFVKMTVIGQKGNDGV